MTPDREIDQPQSERVQLQGQHTTDVRRPESGVQKAQEELRQTARDANQLLFIGRSQDRVAERERTVRFEPD